MIDGWGISCEVALRWLLLDFFDDKSTVVQEMLSNTPLSELMLTHICDGIWRQYATMDWPTLLTMSYYVASL